MGKYSCFLFTFFIFIFYKMRIYYIIIIKNIDSDKINRFLFLNINII